VEPETDPPRMLAIWTQLGCLISGLRVDRPPCALGSNPDPCNYRSSDRAFWGFFVCVCVLLFGSGVQNCFSDSIIRATYVAETCVLSQRPHASPLWPACIRLNDFIVFFGPIVSGTLLFPFDGFGMLPRLQNSSTATFNSSSCYVINTTLSPSLLTLF
jgi:hypothetical protein